MTSGPSGGARFREAEVGGTHTLPLRADPSTAGGRPARPSSGFASNMPRRGPATPIFGSARGFLDQPPDGIARHDQPGRDPLDVTRLDAV